MGSQFKKDHPNIKDQLNFKEGKSLK